jgi:hypothetical protein
VSSDSTAAPLHIRFCCSSLPTLPCYSESPRHNLSHPIFSWRPSVTSHHQRFLCDEEALAAAATARVAPRRAASCDTAPGPPRAEPLRRNPSPPTPITSAPCVRCGRTTRAPDPCSESPACSATACTPPADGAEGGLRAGAGEELKGLRRLGSAPLGPTVSALFGWLGLCDPAGHGP